MSYTSCFRSCRALHQTIYNTICWGWFNLPKKVQCEKQLNKLSYLCTNKHLMWWAESVLVHISPERTYYICNSDLDLKLYHLYQALVSMYSYFLGCCLIDFEKKANPSVPVPKWNTFLSIDNPSFGAQA